MLDASVRVVACLDPLSQRTQKWTEREGVSVVRILRKIAPQHKRFRVVVMVNGHLLKEDQFGFKCRRNDLVNIKVVPRFGGPVGKALSLGTGLLSLGALWLLSRSSSSSNKTSTTQSNTTSPPPATPPDPPPAPIDQYGGPADTVIPAIMGIENQYNNFGPIPSVYGIDVLIKPIKCAQEYFLNVGGNQRMYCVFLCGIGQMDVNNLKLGEKTLASLQAQGLCDYNIRYGSPSDIDSQLTIYTKDVHQTGISNVLSSTAMLATGGQISKTLSVDILFPLGLFGRCEYGYTIAGNGIVRFDELPSGKELEPQACSFLIEYRLHGSGGAWSSFTHNVPAQVAPYAFYTSATWNVVTEGIYDVKITRTTSTAVVDHDVAGPAGSGITFHHHVTPVIDAVWTGLKSIKPVAPVSTILDVNGDHYPLTLIEMWVQASEVTNGTLKNLSCEVSRYLKTYDGASWTAPVVTDSPTWAYVDVKTGFINDSRYSVETVDADKMKEWADFCELKGFTYNRIVSEFMSPEELLDEIASHGRASRHNRDGLLSIVVDKPRDEMVQIFTMDLINNLEWELDFPEYPHAIKAKFRNRDADWEADERTVYLENEDGILYDISTATEFETIDYVGCSDADMAYNLSRFFGVVPRHRPIRYQFDIDAAHICSERGDLVGLNYDVSFDGLGSGVIVSVTDNGTHVTGFRLSQPVVMDDAAANYSCIVRLKDMTLISAPVVNSLTTTQDLVLITPIALSGDHPEVDNYVAFGLLGREVTKCLIESIEHTEDLGAHITLVEYSPEVYDADAGAIPAYVPNVQKRHGALLPTIAPPNVVSVLSDEDAILEAPGALISRIQITLSTPSEPALSKTEIQYRLSGNQEWIPLQSAAITSVVYVTGVQDGLAYDVRLRYDSAKYVGLSSDWTVINSHTVIGQSNPPPDVTSFRRIGSRGVVKYDAEANVRVPVDFAGLEFRWCKGNIANANWDDMQIFGAIGQVTTSMEIDLSMLPPGDDLIVAVKAVDRSGNRSANAAYLRENMALGEYEENEFMIMPPESPAWTGTKTNCHISGSDLVADDSGNAFWNQSGSPFWTDPTSLFWGPGYLSCEYEWNFTPQSDLNQPYRIFLKLHDDDGVSLIEADSYNVYYKRKSQKPFWNSDPTLPFWQAAANLFWDTTGRDLWLPYPQQGLEGSREEFSFKITCLASSNKQPKIKAGVGVIIDVPDVFEEQEIECAAGTGTALVLAETYREIRSIQLTLQYDTVNYPDAFTCAIEKDTLIIRVFDQAQNVVAGKVYVAVKGI